MSKYLVEQIHDRGLRNGELVVEPAPLVVKAAAPELALKYAMTRYPDAFWAFGPEELQITIEDYLWEAADGSMVMIQVRRLPE